MLDKGMHPQNIGHPLGQGYQGMPPGQEHYFQSAGPGQMQTMEPVSGFSEPLSYGSMEAGARAGGRGGKSGKQQAANKIAQQRYRERKKQKYAEMEHAVKEMEEQIAGMQALNKRNSMLEEMNSTLQSQLIAKERELERLKTALDAQADASLQERACSGTDVGVEQANGNGNKPTSACISCDILPQDLTGIDFQTGFADQIAALKKFMEENKLNEPDSSLDPELLPELASLVGRSCQLCQAAIRAEGVKVLDLVMCDIQTAKKRGSDAGKVWEEALEAMQMSPGQEQEMLLLRQSHLDKMKEIYSERQRLNLDAMAMMIPHTSKIPEEDSTLEGRMSTMSSGAYLPLAKSNAELGSILDRIKDNLRREQRSVMDLNCCTISKILTPLQAAKYMVTVYPQHCDALALSNALAKKCGRETSGNASCADSGNNESAPRACGAGCC